MIRAIGILSSLIPIVIFLIFLKRNKERKLWVIFGYVCLSFLTDYFSGPVEKQQLEFEVECIFTFLEYTTITTFFYLTFQIPTYKKVVLASYFLFLIVAIFNFANFRDTNFDTFPTSTEAILVLGLTILYFWVQINDAQVTFIYASKNFWIIVAFLLYLSANLFYFLAMVSLTDNEVQSLNWINACASLMKNICIAIAFWYKNVENRALKPGKSF